MLILLFALFVALALALSAFTEFYCDAAAGANINAGDKTANGVVTSTNGGWSTVTNIFTAAAGTPFSGVVAGDFASVYVDGATTAVYIGRVTAVGGGGATLTVSSTAKSGTAPTTSATARSCTTGGAWKGPNAAENFPFGFITSALNDGTNLIPRVNFKNNATYSITAAITHGNAGLMVFQGYSSAAGDGGKAIIDGGTSGASYILFTVSVARVNVFDFKFQNNGATGSADCVSITGAQSLWHRVVFSNCLGNGVDIVSGVTMVECEAFLCNSSNTTALAGFKVEANSHMYRCIAHDNAGSNAAGFSTNISGATFQECVADTNGGNGFAFTNNNGTQTMDHCVAYGNGAAGVLTSGSAVTLTIQNCIFESNTTYGVNASGTTPLVVLYNNAFYSNTSGQTNGVNASLVTGSITLSGSAFNAASTGDFRLNNTAGAGASCRQAGRGAFTQTQASYTGTVAYPDVGAVETQVVYPTAAQVQSGVTFDVLAPVTGTLAAGNLGKNVIIQNLGSTH